MPVNALGVDSTLSQEPPETPVKPTKEEKGSIMPRRHKKSAKKVKTRKGKSPRGRKPIFSDEQKRLLGRMISVALKEQLRAVVRGM